MGDSQKISSLVTGGAASAGPPLGPALGPLGVNIMEIINAINEKTKDFEGMKVPVTVSVDTDTKKWDITIGIPSSTASWSYLACSSICICRGWNNIRSVE